MRELTPSQKGAVAEAAIAAAALELGVMVLRPVAEGGRYDLAFDFGHRLLRVQCKSARLDRGALVVKIATSRCTPGGYVRGRYTDGEFDAIGAYAPATRECFLLGSKDVGRLSAVHLRVEEPANNQRAGIRWACDHALSKAVDRLRGLPVDPPS